MLFNGRLDELDKIHNYLFCYIIRFDFAISGNEWQRKSIRDCKNDQILVRILRRYAISWTKTRHFSEK